VNNMKQSGTTVIFVLVCVGVLVAAFAIGICIRKARFGGSEDESITAIAPEKSPRELEMEREQARRMPGTGGTDRGGELSTEERAELVKQREGMRERYENMTEEEQEQFRAKMRERFSGRRRGDMGSHLSEEDREKLMKEFEELRARAEEMTEEEREEARRKIMEKYSLPSRKPGGGRGFGDREGGRRRQAIRPDAEQSENN
jgi:hypothetical protein